MGRLKVIARTAKCTVFSRGIGHQGDRGFKRPELSMSETTVYTIQQTRQLTKPRINEVIDTLRSGWLTTGHRTAQFEKEFSGLHGRAPRTWHEFGTRALHLALVALGVGPGDEVITRRSRSVRR